MLNWFNSEAEVLRAEGTNITSYVTQWGATRLRAAWRALHFDSASRLRLGAMQFGLSSLDHLSAVDVNR